MDWNPDTWLKEGPSEARSEYVNAMLGAYGDYMQKSKDFLGPGLSSSMGRNDSATDQKNAQIGAAQPQFPTGGMNNNPLGNFLNSMNKVGPPSPSGKTPLQQAMEGGGRYGVDTLFKNIGGKGLSGEGGFDPNVEGLINNLFPAAGRIVGGNTGGTVGKVGGDLLNKVGFGSRPSTLPTMSAPQEFLTSISPTVGGEIWAPIVGVGEGAATGAEALAGLGAAGAAAGDAALLTEILPLLALFGL